MSVINFHIFNLSTTVQIYQISLNSLSKRQKRNKFVAIGKRYNYEDSEQKLLSEVRWSWIYIKHSTGAQEEHDQQDYIIKV